MLTMSAGNRIRALIDDGALSFRGVPVSATILYFQEAYKRVLLGLLPWTERSAVLLLVGIVTACVFGHHAWTLWLSLPCTGLGLFGVVGTVASVIPSWRALNYTSFLTLHQHDRAMAGLCDALENGRSILLYLRDFQQEETDEVYFALENTLISLIGESQVLVAIANPNADPTLKISPIPRLLSPHALWPELVGHLIERSTRIVVAAGVIGPGIAYELDAIRQRGALGKILFVNMNFDPQLAPPPLLGDFPWQIPVREMIRCVWTADVMRWLGEHAFLTFQREEQTSRPRLQNQSQSIRFLWARMSLMGIRSLKPRSRFAFYRRWLGAFRDFDPLAEVRAKFLAQEQRAAAQGLTILPFRIVFKPKDTKDIPWVDAWNQQQIRTQRIETAVFVLSRRSSWSYIRRALHRTC